MGGLEAVPGGHLGVKGQGFEPMTFRLHVSLM